NNPPINNNQTNMVKYGPPIFNEYPGEDPEDWLREFRRYVVASRINITPGVEKVAERAEALGLAILCFAGPALIWYETCIKDRNWKYNNLLDNLGVVNLNAAVTEIDRIGAGVATGIDIISIGTLEEDWSIATGKLTNDISVALNTGEGFFAITITPNITLGQFLYLVKIVYTSVKHLKQMIVFGQLVQGNMTVEQFFTRIKKIGKLVEMTPKQQKKQFICELSPMNQYNIRIMAKFNDTQNNIAEILAETEKFTLSQECAPSSFLIFPAINPYKNANKLEIFKTEVENLIKNVMASIQSQFISLQPVS
ncbi:2598_t:CDS:2, partial [Acaulospora morrowiae]